MSRKPAERRVGTLAQAARNYLLDPSDIHRSILDRLAADEVGEDPVDVEAFRIQDEARLYRQLHRSPGPVPDEERCEKRHPETEQRCILAAGHSAGRDLATHECESVTWLTWSDGSDL